MTSGTNTSGGLAQRAAMASATSPPAAGGAAATAWVPARTTAMPTPDSASAGRASADSLAPSASRSTTGSLPVDAEVGLRRHVKPREKSTEYYQGAKKIKLLQLSLGLDCFEKHIDQFIKSLAR